MTIMQRWATISLLCLLVSNIQANGQELALTTNIADYLNLGTMNIGAEYGIDRHWSVNAGLKYNPFTFGQDKGLRDKERSLAVGAKFWPWHIFSGWWLSSSAKYQEYNTANPRSPLTIEGDRLGATAGAGYTYMINEHLNLDIGASFWAGYEKRTTYSCPTCGYVVGRSERTFFLPSEVILALTYIF